MIAALLGLMLLPVPPLGAFSPAFRAQLTLLGDGLSLPRVASQAFPQQQVRIRASLLMGVFI